MLAAALILSLLAFGKYSPLPLREFLAEHVLLYRMGRFPSGEHRGFALALWAALSAIGFEALWRRTAGREKAAVPMAAAMVPVGDGRGMGGSAPVERSRRMGPGFQIAVWVAARPPMVKVTVEPSRAHPGRCESWTT